MILLLQLDPSLLFCKKLLRAVYRITLFQSHWLLSFIIMNIFEPQFKDENDRNPAPMAIISSNLEHFFFLSWNRETHSVSWRLSSRPLLGENPLLVFEHYEIIFKLLTRLTKKKKKIDSSNVTESLKFLCMVHIFTTEK